MLARQRVTYTAEDRTRMVSAGGGSYAFDAVVDALAATYGPRLLNQVDGSSLLDAIAAIERTWAALPEGGAQ